MKRLVLWLLMLTLPLVVLGVGCSSDTRPVGGTASSPPVPIKQRPKDNRVIDEGGTFPPPPAK
jgi:hypothetical protein